MKSELKIVIIHWLHTPKAILHKSECFTSKKLSGWGMFISIIIAHSEGVPFPESLTSPQIPKEKLEGQSRNQKVKSSASCKSNRIRIKNDFRNYSLQHCHFSEEETRIKSWNICTKACKTLILGSGTGTQTLTPDTSLSAGSNAPPQPFWNFSARWRSQKTQRWSNFPSPNNWIEEMK